MLENGFGAVSVVGAPGWPGRPLDAVVDSAATDIMTMLEAHRQPRCPSPLTRPVGRAGAPQGSLADT